MSRLDLEGRAAIVTGGARGIGLAVAARLLADGAKVALWDADPAALEAARAGLGADERVAVATVDVTEDRKSVV